MKITRNTVTTMAFLSGMLLSTAAPEKKDEPVDLKEKTEVSAGEAPEAKEKEEPTDLQPLPDLPPTLDYETSDTDQVKYLTPYKPKALGMIPKRWRVEEIGEILIANNNVKLDNGTTTTLRVNAYRIVPNPDENVIAFLEPTFEPSKGNKQENTISAILTKQHEFLAKEEAALEKTLNLWEEVVVLSAERSQKLQEEQIRKEALKAASKKK